MSFNIALYFKNKFNFNAYIKPKVQKLCQLKDNKESRNNLLLNWNNWNESFGSKPAAWIDRLKVS